MTGRRGSLRARAVASVVATLAAPAYATNGLNLLGFGAESMLMAGADVAVSRDAFALTTNPAGLAQLRGRALDFYHSTAHALDVSHADRLGNDAGVDNKFVHVGGVAYAVPGVRPGVAVGIGVFGLGGAGSVYRGLATPFGTRDDLSSLFGVVKPTFGAGWQVDPRLSIGVSVSAAVGIVRQKIFPGTSVFAQGDPARSFFGSRLDSAYGVGVGGKIGVLYHLRGDLTLGATYTHRTRLPLRNGRMTFNMSSIGLGHVPYDEARLEGLGFPRQVAVGLAWRPSDRWLWSWKVEWLDWSDAMTSARLTASGPANPAAPPVIAATQTLGWRDQVVVATGVAVAIGSATTFRAGLNYGRNPVPAERSNPLLNAIGERHVTLGISRRLSAAYELHAGIEYLARNRVRYFNPELPFGPDAELRNSHAAFHVALSRRW